MRIITFLSDFGTRDWFVAAVKGEMLKIAPDASIIDITHDVAPCDVRAAAFLLSAVFKNFPSGTVHLAVVDPGVGGERKPLIIESEGYYFVGPDNGIFSYVLDRDAKAYEIHVGSRVSATFHARDIFGPAAARLAAATAVSSIARATSAVVRIARPEVMEEHGTLRGTILHIDRFGNCITNIPNAREIERMLAGGQTICVKENYGAAQAGRLVCVKGSIGYYEIAGYQSRADEQLKVRAGAEVCAMVRGTQTP